MDSPKDIWHFARPLLAKQYLGEFDLGLISARALFAKRRMGKSTFLERDLIPAAKHAGYITPYLNLWTATQTPAQALLRILSSAVAPKGWPKVLKRLKGMKSVKTSAALKESSRADSRWSGRDSPLRSRRRCWVKAVGRLTRGDILVRVQRGEYQVQDDVFLEWLKRPT